MREMVGKSTTSIDFDCNPVTLIVIRENYLVKKRRWAITVWGVTEGAKSSGRLGIKTEPGR